MRFDRAKMRWNGWGWNEAPDVLGEHAEAIMAWAGKRFGVDPLPHTLAVPLAQVRLPVPRLQDSFLQAVRAALASPDQVKTDAYERAFHARGRSFHDLIWLRSGRFEFAPDAVVYPASSAECQAVLALCAREKVAVVPFGAGSSVVGGVSALAAPGHAGVITMDLALMNQLLDVDKVSMIARAQAGIHGPDLEDALQANGVTLSHYPQSFEFSTLGGWIAPRGAGHQSNKYGKAEHWFAGAEIATPSGLWNTASFPGSAAGPQLRDVIAGSEGCLGVITEASFRIHAVPEVKDYRGYIFMDFAAAVDAHRAMMQEGVPTAMIRLSDYDETRFYTALKFGGQEPDADVKMCAMLVGLEGSAAEVEFARAWSRRVIESRGGMHMGEELGTSWYKGRFETPYLRDPLMDRGAGVDTLETCTRWANLVPLHAAVTKAIQRALDANPAAPGAKGICMAHLSHAYRDGASLYFTFVFPRKLDAEIEQWLAIKRAASETILAHGGTISHHHGVGTDHLEWFAREKGKEACAWLRALKRQADPDNIMNPGKLLP